MSQIFQNLVIEVDQDLEEKLQLLAPQFAQYRILRKSIDARGQGTPKFIYTIEVFAEGEPIPPASEESFAISQVKKYSDAPPIIIGSGPAGLFAAIRLVECGIPCQIFEQGADCKNRILHINKFWRYNELNPLSNVCFGEGGAGLYSDGKLITRIKSPHIPYVLNRLVKFGAPQEIEYLSNPHVGSDRIRRIIPKLREFLIANGCTFHLNTKVTKLLNRNNQIYGVQTHDGRIFESPHVVLAVGHSAEDMFAHLHELGVFMEGKSFALGLRIEHPQKLINKMQFRQHAENEKLGPATYRLTHHEHQTGIGVYSFCMCPGGYVISSTTDHGTVVSNGMSNYNRNGPFANAAVVVSIDHEKTFGKDLFAGVKYRQEIEAKGFAAVQAAGGKQHLPAQKTLDFMSGKTGDILKTSCPSGVTPANFKNILPAAVNEKLKEALVHFDKLMKGFLSPDSQLHGVESRTSCPIRITRDKVTYQSLSHQGLYPTGEGAGYAGGITSAAVDGVRVAEAIAQRYV